MAEENNPAPANAPEEKNQDWTDMIEVRDRGNAASVSGDGDSKILNQEEIDTLFGYSADKEGEDDGYTMCHTNDCRCLTSFSTVLSV